MTQALGSRADAAVALLDSARVLRTSTDATLNGTFRYEFNANQQELSRLQNMSVDFVLAQSSIESGIARVQADVNSTNTSLQRTSALAVFLVGETANDVVTSNAVSLNVSLASQRVNEIREDVTGFQVSHLYMFRDQCGIGIMYMYKSMYV